MRAYINGTMAMMDAAVVHICERVSLVTHKGQARHRPWLDLQTDEKLDFILECARRNGRLDDGIERVLHDLG